MPEVPASLKEAISLAKESGPEKIIEALSARAQAIDSKINAYVHFDPKKINPGNKNKGPLYGVPVSIKDNICTRGWETTCASKILKGYVPPYDATVIAKLKEAGAAIFAKCNMDEFAFGSSNETSTYGPVRNPWDLERVPGGSSGGSAASVAAGEALAALGSDTGGSIRLPAAFCGIVGTKPTYGRVSRYGLIAFGSSFDQIGPLTRTVEDAAIMMNIIAGHDERDSTSAKLPVPDYTKSLKREIKGMRIGLPEEFFIKGMDGEVETAVREAAKVYQKLGAEIKEVSLPHTGHSVAVYYIVAVAEASSNLGRYDGVEYGLRAGNGNLRQMYFETRDQGFGEEAKRRILLGTFVLSAGYYEAYYRQGQKVRTLIRQDYEKAFKEVDLLLTPVAPTPPFKLGEKLTDPLTMYLSDIFTISVNLAGVPAMALPAGFSKSGLPIGMQLIGRPFAEETLFRAAYTYEQETQWFKQRPKI
mgnify:CR=1 FL=1